MIDDDHAKVLFLVLVLWVAIHHTAVYSTLNELLTAEYLPGLIFESSVERCVQTEKT